MNLALWITIIGGVIFAVCDGREKVPAFVANLAYVAFGAGLLAYLLGGK